MAAHFRIFGMEGWVTFENAIGVSPAAGAMTADEGALLTINTAGEVALHAGATGTAADIYGVSIKDQVVASGGDVEYYIITEQTIFEVTDANERGPGQGLHIVGATGIAGATAGIDARVVRYSSASQPTQLRIAASSLAISVTNE